MSETNEEAEATQEKAAQTDLEQAIDEATEQVAVTANELEELQGDAPEGEAVGIDNLLDVPVHVTVEMGRTRMDLGELVKLAPGSLVELDREAHDPADILVNGKVVARGEIVTIGDNYGVRITEVHSGT